MPVDRLQGFARELGARRYGARLPESGPPETVELAQAFNATAVSLEAAEAELRRIGERHLAELDAVFREAPLGPRVRRPRAALPARQRRAGADERPARRRRTSASACGTRTRSPRSSEVLATGEPVLDVEVAIDGRRFEASYFPVRAGGDDPVAVGAAVSDVEAPPARGGRARAPAARHRDARRGRDRRRRRRDGG